MRRHNEIIWKLTGKNPHEIPMARMAEYLQQLAALLGSSEHVYFARVEKGSTQVVAAFNEPGSYGRTQVRLRAVRQGHGADDAMKAFDRIGQMALEDGGRASIATPSANILVFPTRPRPAPQRLSVRDQVTITGKITSLSFTTTGDLRVRIRPRHESTLIHCTANLDLQDQLGTLFMKTARVYGRGRWNRADDGSWTLSDVHITEVQGLHDRPLREAIEALRREPIDWRCLAAPASIDDASLDQPAAGDSH